ncbi:MAG: hypothetical protein UV65_C0019G0004 [Parcubacteria group bacterium GW2011_GWF2_43_11]|nr:MAG: hypothetical protein UV65_C0019G0004 [Parcubacteria group bacterium GW2011_GWF2_43_11]
MFAQKSVLLEIKMPQDVLKPIRAMEQAFNAIWANTFDPPDWWEKWFEGKQLLSVQLEMASEGGDPHFYIRCHESRRDAIESSIYSQYPDAEISLADDYTKHVPQNIPNKEWDLWGTDYIMNKLDVYPILTYLKFFEESEMAKEEKRIDPMVNLLEGMTKMKPGEYLWVQVAFSPITNSKKPEEGEEFIKRGEKERDKLAKRTEKAKQKSILQEAADELISGTIPGAKEEKEQIFPAEMRMTPGEKDMVTGVENKVAKRCSRSYIRFIYLAKRDVYFGGAKAIPFGFFNQFSTENLNQLKPWPRTLTKIKKYVTLMKVPIPINELLRARRVFRKKRRLFFRYIRRFPPLFPKPSKEGIFLLNTEELATIFHFPGRAVAPSPTVPRVGAKRGGAPADLPLELEEE